MRLAFCALLACALLVEKPAGAEEQVALTLMASGRADSTLAEALDLVDTLADGNTLRILPVIGNGPVETLADLLKLDGIDAAILPADALAFAEASRLLPGASSRVSYLAKTGGADIHVLARGSFKALADLTGKRVNLGAPSEARFISGNLIFNALGIAVTPVESGWMEAIKLLKSGAIDAVVLVEQKPSRMLGVLKASDGLHLLAIPPTDAFDDIYGPQVLSDADYPALIGKGEIVQTLSVSHVLAALNGKPGSPRFRQTQRLAAALFDNTAELQSGKRMAQWNDINFAADVPGWIRHAAANRSISEAPQVVVSSNTQAEFRAFLADNPDATGDEAALFARFVEWQKTQAREPEQ